MFTYKHEAGGNQRAGRRWGWGGGWFVIRSKWDATTRGGKKRGKAQEALSAWKEHGWKREQHR